ncbi:TonB family protein [Alteromonas macleodii]|uniref:energy transducer TonB n=1 Tax=Alteromonas macleodii TaxID=28108 RepID=UPI0030CCD441
MNISINVFLCLLFIFASNPAHAKVDDNVRAKLYLKEAEQLFKQGDFENSRVYLTKAEDALGRPVARTLALHIEIEYNLGNFIIAKALIDEYGMNHMDSASPKLNDRVLPLLIDIEKAAEIAHRKKKESELQKFVEQPLAQSSGSSPLIHSSKLTPIKRVSPEMPKQAQREGIEGWVKLRFTINEVGGVEDVEVVDAQPKGVFDYEAKRALRKWVYRPQMVDGKVVRQNNMQVQLNFKLDD